MNLKDPISSIAVISNDTEKHPRNNKGFNPSVYLTKEKRPEISSI